MEGLLFLFPLFSLLHPFFHSVPGGGRGERTGIRLSRFIASKIRTLLVGPCRIPDLWRWHDALLSRDGSSLFLHPPPSLFSLFLPLLCLPSLAHTARQRAEEEQTHFPFLSSLDTFCSRKNIHNPFFFSCGACAASRPYRR